MEGSLEHNVEWLRKVTIGVEFIPCAGFLEYLFIFECLLFDAAALDTRWASCVFQYDFLYVLLFLPLAAVLVILWADGLQERDAFAIRYGFGE